MARPRKHGEQELRAYKLYKQSLGVSAITTDLETTFDEPVSKRTVERWVLKFKETPAETDKTDQALNWDALSDELPEESVRYLLSMWAYAVENALEDELAVTPSGTRCPSQRQAEWWWKLHQASPEAPRMTILIMGNELANRALLRELDLGPREDHDIWAFFAFNGWKENLSYGRCIDGGWIPHWSVLGRDETEVAQKLKSTQP